MLILALPFFRLSVLASVLLGSGLAGGSPTAGGSILQERQVRIDVARLKRSASSAPSLLFTPFQGTSLLLAFDAGRPGALAETILFGRVIGDPAGWARLVFNEDVVVGDVTSRLFGTYEIRPTPTTTAGSRHVVRRVDPGRKEVCDAVLLPLRTPPVFAGSFEIPPTSQGETVDVMVVYTPSAVALAGGTAAIEATIDSYVDYANQVYGDSGIQQRLRLVRAAEVAYVESGNSITDLVRLRDRADGFMDGIHALRDAVGADCVSLIATSGSAGVAFLMTPVSPLFESCAFSAIGHDVGGLVFAHELGHNMGCGHNNGPGAPPAAFCFSYGHRTPDDAWRTVMSNAPGTHVDFFSSPALTFAGFPLGVSGAGCPQDAADNVTTMNMTAEVVAGFRRTVVP
jgi:hypothetical protein